MYSHRALLIGVLIPAALSHAFYHAWSGRRHAHRASHFERTFSSADFTPPPAPWGPDRPWGPPPPPATHIESCAAREVRTFSIPADATDRIDLPAGLGDLHIDGVAGLDHADVEATLCASSTEALGRMDVALQRDGAGLRVETRYDGAQAAGDSDGHVDLRLSLPLGMKATLGGDELPGSKAHARPARPRRRAGGRGFGRGF